jgi:hypothetical protein
MSHNESTLRLYLSSGSSYRQESPLGGSLGGLYFPIKPFQVFQVFQDFKMSHNESFRFFRFQVFQDLTLFPTIQMYIMFLIDQLYEYTKEVKQTQFIMCKLFY